MTDNELLRLIDSRLPLHMSNSPSDQPFGVAIILTFAEAITIRDLAMALRKEIGTNTTRVAMPEAEQ